MAIDVAKLKRASTAIRNVEGNWYHCGDFTEFFFAFSASVAANPSKERIKSVYRLRRVCDELQSSFTLVGRLVAFENLHAMKAFGFQHFIYFASLDLKLLVVSMRSLIDHATELVCLGAAKPGTIAKKSFHELKSGWIPRSRGSSRIDCIGEDLARLVEDAGWFVQLKKVRDSIVHDGHAPRVFVDNRRIGFCLMDEATNLAPIIPEVALNEYCTDFELFVGVYFGYLLALLEDLAVFAALRQHLKIEQPTGWGWHYGSAVVKSCIERAIEKAEIRPAT